MRSTPAHYARRHRRHRRPGRHGLRRVRLPQCRPQSGRRAGRAQHDGRWPVKCHSRRPEWPRRRAVRHATEGRRAHRVDGTGMGQSPRRPHGSLDPGRRPAGQRAVQRPDRRAEARRLEDRRHQRPADWAEHSAGHGVRQGVRPVGPLRRRGQPDRPVPLGGQGHHRRPHRDRGQSPRLRPLGRRRSPGQGHRRRPERAGLLRCRQLVERQSRRPDHEAPAGRDHGREAGWHRPARGGAGRAKWRGPGHRPQRHRVDGREQPRQHPLSVPQGLRRLSRTPSARSSRPT